MALPMLTDSGLQSERKRSQGLRRCSRSSRSVLLAGVGWEAMTGAQRGQQRHAARVAARDVAVGELQAEAQDGRRDVGGEEADFE